jgi:hypothetical protein
MKTKWKLVFQSNNISWIAHWVVIHIKQSCDIDHIDLQQNQKLTVNGSPPQEKQACGLIDELCLFCRVEAIDPRHE